MIDYTVRSAVLLIAFNRPDATMRVFNIIRSVKPAKLYFAVDGPRLNVPTDVNLCMQVRTIPDMVDWDCKVYTYFSNENKGCKIGVSSALNRFFSEEEEGIVLEDDCLPSKSFFYFCDQMLEKYRLDTRVHTITGTNLQNGVKRGEASYYFSNYANIWGWASWRRVWQKYDIALDRYEGKDVAKQLRNVFNDRFLIDEWVFIFNEMKAGKIDTWDYQLSLITFFENGLCITPNVNLISNIGFRTDATHTNDTANAKANLPIGELWTITHPLYFTPDKEADYFFLSKEFSLSEKWNRYNKRSKRFKRWLKGLSNTK